MFRLALSIYLILFFSLTLLKAEEAQALNADEKKKIEALVKDLGDDEFSTRVKAHAALSSMGLKALPMVKAAAADTQDNEVKVRCEQLIGSLALEAETNPIELAKLARMAALAQRYGDAAKLYHKTAGLLQGQADKTEDPALKNEYLGRIKKTLAREKHARAMAYSAIKVDGGGLGAGIRIQMVGGGMRGGVIVVDDNGNQEEVLQDAQEDW